MIIRPVNESELVDVIRLQDSVYPVSHQEPINTFESMLRVYPQGSLVAVDQGIIGYLFFHPGLMDEVQSLCSELKLPLNPDCMYLHDLVVSHECRGLGVSDSLLQACYITSLSEGFNELRLVAVYGAESFWQRIGFVGLEWIDYGGEKALRMSKSLN